MKLDAKTVAGITRAKRAEVEARTTLWNMRLEALLDAGTISNALDFAGSSIEDTINNCNCNVQCGALRSSAPGTFAGSD